MAVDGVLVERIGVRLSALDGPFDREPQKHIHVRSVAPWETLPDDGAERWNPGD